MLGSGGSPALVSCVHGEGALCACFVGDDEEEMLARVPLSAPLPSRPLGRPPRGPCSLPSSLTKARSAPELPLAVTSLPVAALGFRKKSSSSGEARSPLGSPSPDPAARASDSHSPRLPEIKARYRMTLQCRRGTRSSCAACKANTKLLYQRLAS